MKILAFADDTIMQKKYQGPSCVLERVAELPGDSYTGQLPPD